MLEEIVAMIHTDVPSGQLELHIAKYKTECKFQPADKRIIKLNMFDDIVSY
jgi:hypothetical protein